MRREIKILTIATLLTIATVLLVYAVTQITFYQELTVPTGNIKVEVYDYQQNKWVEIQDGDDISGNWTWYSSTNSFNATIRVTNIGQSTVDITITCSDLETGWIFTYVGDTNDIPVGESRIYKLSVHNPNAESGDSTGTFSITISIA